MKLSIAMPSKNQGQFISAALDSVIAQHDGDNLEILVHDCISSDNTKDQLLRYGCLPFVMVHRRLDHGQSDAIATALQQASGDIFGWLNSDDVLYPHTVDLVLNLFHSNPHVDIVYGDAVYIDSEGHEVGRFPTATPSLRALTHRCVLSQPSVFFRKEAYRAVGGLNRNRRYCMDYELWLRFAQHRFTFARIAKTCSATRLHGATKTFNGGFDFIEEICRMQDEVLGFVSPVWSVYRRARSKPIADYSNKLVRFSFATLSEVMANPRASLTIGEALIERAGATWEAHTKRPRAT